MQFRKPPKPSPLNSNASSLRLDRKRFLLEQFSTTNQKIIGSHKRIQTNTSIQYLISESDIRLQKFKRTPSPQKSIHRSSPSKPEYVRSGKYIELLRENLDSQDPLSLKKSSQRSLETLKKQGFMNQRGQINKNFLTRYIDIISSGPSIKRTNSLTLIKSAKN